PFIWFSPALAKMSIGAPVSICLCSTPEAAKLKFTRVPVFVLYRTQISLNASLSEAAAETVIPPVGPESVRHPQTAIKQRSNNSFGNTFANLIIEDVYDISYYISYSERPF